MGWAKSGARHWIADHRSGNHWTGRYRPGNSGLRNCIFGCAAIAAALAVSAGSADARYHRRGHVHLAHRFDYAPPSASIVVDGNSGTVLEQSNPDAPRHPASLTKVMTLYLLFTQIEAGRISLDTPLAVSEHAAEQAPTKLDLEPGSTITVADAIKGIVTRSANDAAVVIAENLAGSEQAFAKLMTERARALGMTRTTYVNASGLPDDDQITTARDQALLGRAIQDRFPRYYRFFSTTAFLFHGRIIRGHNHLLGEVPGVDGIKTGFTSASGFNLLTSVHHEHRYLVAVVLGGRSAGERDAHMRALIAANMPFAALTRAAPALATSAPPTTGEPRRLAGSPGRAAPPLAITAPLSTGGPRRLASTRGPVRADRTARVPTAAAVGSNAPIRPVVVNTITYGSAAATARAGAPPVQPARTASAEPAPVAEPAPRPQGAEPAPRAQAAEPAPSAQAVEPAPRIAEGAMMEEPVAPPAAAPAQRRADLVQILTGTESSAAAPVDSAAVTPPAAAAPAHNGWMIQIGAFDDEAAARAHLDAAKRKLPELAAADPFTEPVQRGDTTLYRARFSGLDQESAEADCRKLRRSEVQCLAFKE